ncbi:hypothetical protein SDC9_186973 [bioreactor metagenome]|uniref:Uncharacterized protein n=1 Tax=bioreactor metagenome TaxID=1076179 RepID=A0A645HKA5_9ZZZZ
MLKSADGNIKGRYRDGQKKTQYPHEPCERSIVIIQIVIFIALEIFNKKIGDRQYHGGAVHQDGDTAFQDLGHHNIRSFRIAYGTEGRNMGIFNHFRDIVGVQNAVDLNLLQAAMYFF